MITLINELRKTTKRTEKEKLLEHASEIEKDLLRLCYDPFTLSYVKKVPAPRATGSRAVKESFADFVKLYKALSTRQLTGNAALEAVKQFLESVDADAQQVYSLILKKDIKAGISIKTLNKVFGDNFIEDFTVQLANKWKENKTYPTKTWYVSPKLDGLRAIYLANKKLFLTRKGKPIIGFEHIEKELQMIVEQYNLTFIDGELFSSTLDFQTIQGYVMAYKNINKEHKQKIYFNIFAVGNDNIKTTKDMVELIDTINTGSYVYLRFVPQTEIANDAETIKVSARKFVEQGYEGAMLRHPVVWYEWKRSDALLKVKFFNEADLRVVDMIEGTGKYENMLGALVVEGVVEGHSVKTEVGTGFSDAQREEFWRDKDTYVGVLAEIKYQNVTDDGTSLRFPVFVKFKLDR